MAYNEPVSFQYKGNKEVALRYVREARRRIYEFLKYLTPSGATSGRRTFKYPGGVLIEVVVAQRIVRVTIFAPLSKTTDEGVIDDFVVHARDETLPDGIDATHPQQILRKTEDDWLTYFYDANVDMYPDFDRPKGTYKNNRGSPMFPDGIRHSGNVDWRSLAGERISWYGPDNRYFFDAFRQPNAQYGRYVFHLGQILLDVDAFCVAIDENWQHRLVMGAAVRQIGNDRWLYVMFSDMQDVSTPVVTVPAQSVYFSQCFPQGQVNFALRRILLRENPSTEGAMKWSVVPGTQENLWTAFANGACHPWIFSPDGTQMSTVILAGPSSFVFDDDSNRTMPDDSPPHPINTRIEATIGEDSAPPTFSIISTFIPAGNGSAVLTTDYTDTGELVVVRLSRESYALSPNAIVLRIGASMYPMFFLATPRDGFVRRAVNRRIMWMDARTGTVAFAAYFDDAAGVDGAPGAYALEIAVEIYQNGVLLHRQVTATDSGTGYTEIDSNALEASARFQIAPLVWIYSLFGTFGLARRRASLRGMIYSMTAEPVHPSEGFGQFGARTNTAGPSTPVVGENNFNTAPMDIHNHRVSSSAAARTGVVVASLSWPGIPDGRSVHFITGGNLPTVTGVGGSRQRYHPIWMLGQPLGTDIPQ